MSPDDNQAIPFTRRHERCLFENHAAIQRNADAIAKNAVGIGKNSASIAKNAEGIAKNAEGIAKNREEILENRGEIRSLKTEVSRLGIMMEESEKRQMTMLEILVGVLNLARSENKPSP